MATLRKYTPQVITEVTASLRQQLANRTIEPAALSMILDSFKFRGPEGDTWTLGPRSRTWYRYRRGAWSPATLPNVPMDGPIDFLTMGLLAPKPPSQAPEISPDASPTTTDPASYLQTAVQRVRAAYARGAIHTGAAEGLLDELYALDGTGTVWAVGVQSNAWYTFAGNGWQRSSQAPDLSSFTLPLDKVPKFCGNCGSPLEGQKFCTNCGTAAPSSGNGGGSEEKVAEGLVRLLTSGAELFPEPVVPQWDPPAGFPEPVVVCPHCGAPNVGPHDDCISCQRAIQPRHPAAQSVQAAQQPSTARPRPVSERTPSHPPQPRRSSRWLRWVLAGGCSLIFLCALCSLIFWVLNENYLFLF